MPSHPDNLSIVVVGASGDLARKKIYPALFALYCQNLLPAEFHVFGFARTEFTEGEFREKITEHLTCRYVPGESCQQHMDEFLARCRYVSGAYDDRDAMLDLYQAMREVEGGQPTNRFYYLAIPPSIFVPVARAIGDAGLVVCGAPHPWSRVVIEKPFGHDRSSSDELAHALSQVFSEDQTYRIDHYLGKEVIQNLLVLRFANTVFEPLWNRQFIQSIQILWKENIGLEGRGGYFDRYGIIRDVMQNHLLQILALVTMEPPARLDPVHIATEKVNVLRCIPPLEIQDVVLGQYGAAQIGGYAFSAYTDDSQVPDDSRTPTFACAHLHIHNSRWQGVPMEMVAGKGLDARLTEIRIRFRAAPSNMFCVVDECPEANELVIRVQPDEAIHLSFTSKVPGSGLHLRPRSLDLQYKTAFAEKVPDAYESLLLEVIRGDQSLFIRRHELEAAWDIFTPLLQQLESERIAPQPYPFGSQGPVSVHVGE